MRDRGPPRDRSTRPRPVSEVLPTYALSQAPAVPAPTAAGGVSTLRPASGRRRPGADGRPEPRRWPWTSLYAPWPTPLARRVRRGRCGVVRGLRCCLQQATAQVELMTGRSAPVDAMRPPRPAALAQPRAEVPGRRLSGLPSSCCSRWRPLGPWLARALPVAHGRLPRPADEAVTTALPRYRVLLATASDLAALLAGLAVRRLGLLGPRCRRTIALGVGGVRARAGRRR